MRPCYALPIITVAPAGQPMPRCDPPPRWCCDPAPPLAWRYPACRNGVLVSSRRVEMLSSSRRVEQLRGGCR